MSLQHNENAYRRQAVSHIGSHEPSFRQIPAPGCWTPNRYKEHIKALVKL